MQVPALNIVTVEEDKPTLSTLWQAICALGAALADSLKRHKIQRS